MEKEVVKTENQGFWIPKRADSLNLMLRYPLLSYSQRTFMRFVKDVFQTYSDFKKVGFEGFPKVSEGYVRLHLLEYALHYIHKFEGKLPPELQTPIQQALTLAFNGPQRTDDSTLFHFPFITESYMYRTVYRQLHTVDGEYCIRSLDSLSGFISEEILVMIVEDIINGSMIDMKDVETIPGEVSRAYANVLWQFLPEITRYGSQSFGPVLVKLVLRADDTQITYTKIEERDGKRIETEESTSRRLILMNQVSRLLNKWSGEEGKEEIADSFMSYVATLQRDREMDNYWLTFIPGTPRAEGVREFILATFFHWDGEYKKRIIRDIRTMSEYIKFQAEGLQDQYIPLIDELLGKERDAEIRSTLEALKKELEQIDTQKAKEQWQEAQAEARRGRDESDI
ncbi:hypothetical protein ACFLY9_01665 [Patescibacteria group bacterium]